MAFGCCRYKHRILLIALIVIFFLIMGSFFSHHESIKGGKKLLTNHLISKNKHDTTNNVDYGEAETEMEERVDYLNKKCKELKLGKYSKKINGRAVNRLNVKDPPAPQYSYFFLNQNYNIGWCPVYKAGSTSWLHNMMLLKGVSEKELESPPKQLSIWARDIYGEPEYGQLFDNSIKMLVVRHPFERVLSAFRDKLSNSTIGNEHGTAHFYLKYGRNIVRKFRSKSSKIKSKEPTFEEFVRYLLNTDLVLYSDDHWLPVYYSCTPCHLNYKFIAKTETFSRDQNYIINKLSLNSVLKKSKWKHRVQKTSNSDRSAQKYFSQLSKTQIEALYQKYELDFLLFNYSWKDYLAYAKS